jgi:hypothetical protein
MFKEVSLDELRHVCQLFFFTDMLLPLSRVLRRHVLNAPRAYRLLRTKSFPPLPELTEWRSEFNTSSPAVRERVSIRNQDTADMLANNFLNWTGVKGPKVIIEAFPGLFSLCVIGGVNSLFI